MRKITLTICLLILASGCAFAQEVITEYDNKSLPVLNDELRRTSRRIRELEGTLSMSTLPGIVPLAHGGTGVALADPNADRILFWDDSAGAVTWLTAGSGVTISGTTVSTTLPTSNVLFQYAGQVINNGASEGEVVGTTLNPNGATGNFRFLQHTGGTYGDVFSSKFTKVAGISTVTVYGQIWVRANGGGSPNNTANLKVIIGSVNGEVAGTSAQTSPEWKSFTIDVSGLSNGTTYDVTALIKDSGVGADETYLGNLIAFGS